MKIPRLITAVIAAVMILFCCTGCDPAGSGGGSGEGGDIGDKVLEKLLDSREREIFDSLAEYMKKVSEGERGADTFSITVSKPFVNSDSYKRAIRKAAHIALYYKPQYSFWTSGGYSYSVYNDNVKCSIKFNLSPAYFAVSDKIRPGRLPDVEKALSNARSIADKYAGKNSYDKVIGYAKEICALNEYNYDAVNNRDDYIKKNSDLWAMIYIFDGDPNTKAVCAGYTAAFKYLCDLGGIECYVPTGYLGDGGHAWNVVVIDGVSYFVDVTNCDNFPEKYIDRYHPLIMNGVAANTADGFEVRYVSPAGAYSYTYTYDEDEMEYLPEEIRLLSVEGYTRPQPKTGAVIVIILCVAVIVLYNARKRKKLREFAARMEAQLQAEEGQVPGQSSEQDIFPDEK